MLTNLPTDKLTLRPDARPINPAMVSGIADGIAKGEPIPPLRVRPMGDGWEVTYGGHRLAAHKLLGLAEVLCDVREDSDETAELAMIDENLIREELSPADRARYTLRKREIYHAEHPEAKRGGYEGHVKLSTIEYESFAANTSRLTGRGESSVMRDAERGDRISDEVLDMIRGTPLDTGVYLDKLKRLSPNDQYRAVERDLALQRNKNRQVAFIKSAHGERQRDAQKAAKAAGEIIAANMPSGLLSALLGHLEASGKASDVARAIRKVIE